MIRSEETVIKNLKRGWTIRRQGYCGYWLEGEGFKKVLHPATLRNLVNNKIVVLVDGRLKGHVADKWVLNGEESR